MNLYQPYRVTIKEITDETPDTRTLKLEFQDSAVAETFDFKAGQFGEYSVFGSGECTFCIASSPTRKGSIECSFKTVGKVTKAMRGLDVGDTMGFRGPYGNHFPLERMEKMNVVFIAGGIGLAPVRCVIWNVLDLRDSFGDVTIIHGARSVSDLVYKRELEEWERRGDVKVWKTVDPGGETEEWRGETGFVPAIVEKAAPTAQNSCAVVCGPPVMIKYTLPVLRKLGFDDDRIYTTMENRMKCGLGKCGRCNIGPVYVCKDGPVFTARELASLPADA
ncbi:MAG: FAD/NAD(P)-binding protein [Acidobacteria bacterium]|nr:FAD/NAD(P)-binding protein [Acidobacteriota bacterium]MCG3191483.1 Anaerobic sulfite reductase subunit B [Thermoanaerobaculia bacterium]MCK6681860.1 FAD/NAD(P)-binding protein [Thermoanaerobaculia bacterium]